MALTYAQIKGAQGVAPGVIIPFSREVQSANQQLDRVPGGYLRCNGTVFQARDYPDLARVIGVGASGGGGVSGCRFPPGISGTALLNPTFDANNNFTAGTFCVPNLGAKFLMPNNTAGSQYVGDAAMSGGGVIERAGIGYKAQVQSTANASYTGMVRVEEYKAPSVGSPTLTVTGGTVSTVTLDISNVAAHDHGVGADPSLAPKINSKSGVGFDTDIQNNSGSAGFANFGANFNIETLDPDPSHNHSIGGSATSNLMEFTQPRVDLDFTGSTATCSLTADAREHLNHVSSPYMIMEFIIKY